MRWLTVLFAAFIIAVIVLADLGHLPSFLRVYERIPYGDKVGHFILIGILGFLAVTTSIQALPHRDPKRVAIIAALILALVFTVEEASQGPIAGRDASWMDLFANYAGISTFSFLAYRMKK
ncbi:MAG: VanZ family protein [Chloroflexota bacterium]